MVERFEDLNLFNVVIIRIIKEVFLDGVNIFKEVWSVIFCVVSVFVLYVIFCVNNFVMKGKCKMLNVSDVFLVMEEMEFQWFVILLKEVLEVYRWEQKGKKEVLE